jgi:hypothetical protein
MLEQELASTNLLFRESEKGNYEFIHKTWQEFFTGKSLLERYRRKEIDEAELDRLLFSKIDYGKWRFNGLSINNTFTSSIRFSVPYMDDYYNHFMTLVLDNYSVATRQNYELFRPKYNLLLWDLLFIGDLASKSRISSRTISRIKSCLKEQQKWHKYDLHMSDLHNYVYNKLTETLQALCVERVPPIKSKANFPFNVLSPRLEEVIDLKTAVNNLGPTDPWNYASLVQILYLDSR